MDDNGLIVERVVGVGVTKVTVSVTRLTKALSLFTISRRSQDSELLHHFHSLNFTDVCAVSSPETF